MEHTEENLPLAVEKHYNGKIIARASLANPITQSYQSLVILRSKTSKKIILLLEEVPIEFDTI